MKTDFKHTKLPEYLRDYHKMFIKTILYGNVNEINKIGFLTIQESFVEKGNTQRRPGLHVECPGLVNIAKGAGDVIEPEQRVFTWGLGSYSVQENRFRGGIYMASNVAQSCRLWNCRV